MNDKFAGELLQAYVKILLEDIEKVLDKNKSILEIYNWGSPLREIKKIIFDFKEKNENTKP